MEASDDDVAAAFDCLKDEVKRAVEKTQVAISEASAAGRFDLVKSKADLAKAQSAFISEVDALRGKWRAIGAAGKPGSVRVHRRNHPGRRASIGTKTSEPKYYGPILNTLVQLGGSARIGEVLDRVFDILRSTLREADLESIPSDPNMPRWRNTAQWARQELVDRGLMRNDSPRGVWEITDAGREWLKDNA